MIQKANPRVCQFADVKIGELFRALRPDRIKDPWADNGIKEIPSSGLYVKCGTAVSADIAHDNKDAIFSMKLPCRVLPKIVDASKLEMYQVCHRNKNKKAA